LKKSILLITLLFSLSSIQIADVLASEQTSVGGYYTNTITKNDMAPAIIKDDQIYSDPDYYKTHKIKRGEIVIIESPSNTGFWAKRVIGLPGESIELKGGLIYINGSRLVEDYVSEENNKGWVLDIKGLWTIPDGKYCLLGDNRSNSRDSRHIGFIREKDILAKVMGIFLTSELKRNGEFESVTYNGLNEG